MYVYVYIYIYTLWSMSLWTSLKARISGQEKITPITFLITLSSLVRLWWYLAGTQLNKFATNDIKIVFHGWRLPLQCNVKLGSSKSLSNSANNCHTNATNFILLIPHYWASRISEQHITANVQIVFLWSDTRIKAISPLISRLIHDALLNFSFCFNQTVRPLYGYW